MSDHVGVLRASKHNITSISTGSNDIGFGSVRIGWRGKEEEEEKEESVFEVS